MKEDGDGEGAFKVRRLLDLIVQFVTPICVSAFRIFGPQRDFTSVILMVFRIKHILKSLVHLYSSTKIG
jgi:hypothetical protein